MTGVLWVRPPSRRVKRLVVDGERILEEVRWHPTRLIRPGVVLLIAFSVELWLGLRATVGSWVFKLVAIALLVTAGAAVLKGFEWWHERFVATNRRLLLLTGLLTRRIGVLPLGKVTDMTFERSLFARLPGRWGWGTFVVESAGQNQAFHRITFVPYPDDLYQKLSEELFGEKPGPAGGPPPPSRSPAGGPPPPSRSAPPSAPQSAASVSPSSAGAPVENGEERPWWDRDYPDEQTQIIYRDGSG